MSLQAQLDRLNPQLQNPHNVAVLDIERIPGRAIHHHRGIRMEGDFWDLNAWKHTLSYRLPADSVVEWPRTICVAWRWYGQNRIHFASEWGDGHQGMIETVWEVFDRAQIVVGHNSRGFDEKKLKTDWRDYGLLKPSPWKSVDTLTIARREFGDESNTLDALCRRAGIPHKTDKYDVTTARAAVAGDKRAQRKLRLYNMGDIDASTALYDRFRPWDSTHPHSVVPNADDRPTCHACWGDDLEPNGTTLARQITYRLYRCRGCGSNVVGTQHARAAVTRGVR